MEQTNGVKLHITSYSKFYFEINYRVDVIRTAALKIHHLMFINDVMVFFNERCHGILHIIIECLDDFARWSGLAENRNRTKLFTLGLNQCESWPLILSFRLISGNPK